MRPHSLPGDTAFRVGLGAGQAPIDSDGTRRSDIEGHADPRARRPVEASTYGTTVQQIADSVPAPGYGPG